MDVRPCVLGVCRRYYQAMRSKMNQEIKQPSTEQILQAMLVLLKAQVALLEMQLAGKTQDYF